MKLSFSLPPKSNPRVRLNSDRNDGLCEANIKEFVTEFDSSEILPDAKPKYVIPPIGDRRNPYKESKITDHLFHSASGLQFESEIPSVDPHVSPSTITYGLNMRHKIEAASKPEPVEQKILKNIRKDLESLPDAPELEDFESCPVDGFGAALLAGYGWKPGQGIGLNAKEDVQVRECKKCIGTEGFGFNPDYSRVKGITKAKGKIIEQLGSASHEEVKVGIKEITNVEKDRVMRKRSRKTEQESRSEIRVFKQNYNTSQSIEKASWLRSHIKVRIISKAVKGGRLYLKKGVVTDVAGPKTCDITMDETQELVQGIDQKLLETALPRRGGQVLVLSGRHKGLYGSLVDKDLDKETGVVCDADSQEMIHVKLEHVAEYMGDPGDIGY